MAQSVCLSIARTADLSNARLHTRPSTASRASRNGPMVVCSAKKSSSHVAVSVAAAAATMLLPLDPAMVSALALTLPTQQEASAAPDLLSQLSLSSQQAPAIGLLADDEDLTPAERARQLAAEYKRRKEEDAAARAAAVAEDQARNAPAPPPEEIKPAPRTNTGFFGGRVEEPKPASAPVVKAPEPVKVVKEEPKIGKKNKRGGLPLFASQLGVLAAFSGMIAAAVVVPKSEWEKVEKKVSEIGAKVTPVLEEYYEKSKPLLEQAKVKGGEFLEEAKPVVAKAYEQARPVVAQAVEKAVETAKPLVAQAQEAVVAQVSRSLSTKEEKPSVSSNGSPKVTVIEPKSPASSQSEAKL